MAPKTGQRFKVDVSLKYEKGGEEKMVNIRKKYSGAFKAKVALEAVKAKKTISEISSKYGVHPNQARQWRKQMIEELPSIFMDRKNKAEKARDELEAELYRQIGQLKVELDWLKKN